MGSRFGVLGWIAFASLTVVVMFVVVAASITVIARRSTGEPNNREAALLEADEVTAMKAGGFAAPPQIETGVTINSSRHVLRAESAMGPVDLFFLSLAGLDGEQRPQSCVAITFPDGGLNLSCGLGGQPPIYRQGDNLVASGSTADRLTMVEILGPARTTHFTFVRNGRRIVVVPVEGRAMLFSEVPVCAALPDLVEAWDDDVLIASSGPPEWCD